MGDAESDLALGTDTTVWVRILFWASKRKVSEATARPDEAHSHTRNTIPPLLLLSPPPSKLECSMTLTAGAARLLVSGSDLNSSSKKAILCAHEEAKPKEEESE